MKFSNCQISPFRVFEKLAKFPATISFDLAMSLRGNFKKEDLSLLSFMFPLGSWQDRKKSLLGILPTSQKPEIGNFLKSRFSWCLAGCWLFLEDALHVRIPRYPCWKFLQLPNSSYFKESSPSVSTHLDSSSMRTFWSSLHGFPSVRCLTPSFRALN